MEDPFLAQLASPNRPFTQLNQTFELVESSPIPNSSNQSKFYMWGYSPDFNMKKDDEIPDAAGETELKEV